MNLLLLCFYVEELTFKKPDYQPVYANENVVIQDNSNQVLYSRVQTIDEKWQGRNPGLYAYTPFLFLVL